MYIVLADDLTGAMDTGIQFRKYGIQTSVIVSADDCELRGDSCAGAVSINNSSRELSGSEAYEKTLRAVHRLSLSPQDILYKKIDCNGVQREHNKKLNNGLPILHKVPPKRDYGRYFCIMAEKGGTSHGGLTEKLSPFFHAKKQEVNAYGR